MIYIKCKQKDIDHINKHGFVNIKIDDKTRQCLWSSMGPFVLVMNNKHGFTAKPYELKTGYITDIGKTSSNYVFQALRELTEQEVRLAAAPANRHKKKNIAGKVVE